MLHTCMPCPSLLDAPCARPLFHLLCPCSGYKAETSLQAHPGGFAALDARGELVASCGYVSRMGRLALDTYAKVGCACMRAARGLVVPVAVLLCWPLPHAGRRTEQTTSVTYPAATVCLPATPNAQVFDVRMGARMLASVPFAPGPAMLRFHPRFSSTLLLASASGAFTLADAQGMSGRSGG